MKASRIGVALFALVLMACMSTSAFAQAAGGAGGRGGNNAGGRQRGGNNNGGNFDPAAMRERYLTQLKEQLGSPDEEWKLLQPKLDKVLTVQRETRTNRGGFGGGRTRGGNQDANATPAAPAQPQSAVATASDDLRKAVADKGTSAEDLAKKITALREAKEKAKNDLAAAQKELRELLSARQEAVLITNGILD
jgi:hypothetical protein